MSTKNRSEPAGVGTGVPRIASDLPKVSPASADPAPERQLEIIRTLTPAARPPSPVAPGLVIVTEPKSKHMETFS